MPTTYEVHFADEYGVRVAIVDQLETLAWGRKLNEIGAFELRIAADLFNRKRFTLDGHVEIWRKPEDTARMRVFYGFMRYLEQGYSGSDHYYLIKGIDVIDLLARRIIAYNAGSSGSDKGPDYAGNIIKAYVNENLGPGAPAARRLGAGDLTIQPNLNDGASGIEKSASRRNLLTTLQDLAETSAQNGTRIYYDIVRTTSGFEFRTYQGQRGQDRTKGSGYQVVLSVQHETLANAVLVQDWREEVTYVYGGGQGQEDEREIVEVNDAARLNMSQYNRREEFFNGLSYEETTPLTDASRKRLWEGRPQRTFRADIIDRPGNRLGKHWDFGDRVTALFENEEYTCIVDTIAVTVTSAGEEVQARIEYAED